MLIMISCIMMRMLMMTRSNIVILKMQIMNTTIMTMIEASLLRSNVLDTDEHDTGSYKLKHRVRVRVRIVYKATPPSKVG